MINFTQSRPAKVYYSNYSLHTFTMNDMPVMSSPCVYSVSGKQGVQPLDLGQDDQNKLVF